MSQNTKVINTNQLNSLNKLFVGGIPHNTTCTELSLYFSKFGPVKDIQLPTHKKSGKLRGFAFIEFEDPHSTHMALSFNHPHILRNKKMAVRPAMNAKTASNVTKKLQSRKIYAKGFPYDASEEEISLFFSKFGEVDRVLMGKSANGQQFRGFAYIIMGNPEAYRRVFERALEQGSCLSFRGQNIIKIFSSKTREQMQKIKTQEGSARLLNELDSLGEMGSEMTPPDNYGKKRQLVRPMGESFESTFSKKSSAISRGAPHQLPYQGQHRSAGRPHTFERTESMEDRQRSPDSNGDLRRVRSGSDNRMNLESRLSNTQISTNNGGMGQGVRFPRPFLMEEIEDGSRSSQLGSFGYSSSHQESELNDPNPMQDDENMDNLNRFASQNHPTQNDNQRELTGQELIRKHNLIFRSRPRPLISYANNVANTQASPNRSHVPMNQHNLMTRNHQDMNFTALFTGGNFSGQQGPAPSRNQHFGPQNAFGDNESDPEFMRERYSRDIEGSSPEDTETRRYFGPNFLPGFRRFSSGSSSSGSSETSHDAPSVEIKQTITTKYLVKSQGVVYTGTLNETNVWGSHPHEDYQP